MGDVIKKIIFLKYFLFRNVVVFIEFDFNVGSSISILWFFDMLFWVILFLCIGYNILIVLSVYFYEFSMVVDIVF